MTTSQGPLTTPEPVQAPAYARTPERSALLALVDAHFFGDGPHPLQLVCTTENAHDVECGTTIALVEPGTEWDELEARIAEHAAARHAVRRCARCGHVLVDEDDAGWYYQTPVTDPRMPGLTFMDRVHECGGQSHDVRVEAKSA